MVKSSLIKVELNDEKILMNECKQLFLSHHPEMKGMRITRAFMFKKIITYYLEG